MIPVKTFVVPAPKETVLRILPETEGGRVTGRTLTGFSEKGNAFVPAEGAEKLELSASLRGAGRLFGAEEKLFAGMNGFYVVYPDDGAYSAAGNCNGVVSFWNEAGERTFYLLWDRGLTAYSSPDDFRNLKAIAGGDCIAVHRERIFVGDKNTLHYSAPLKPEAFSAETEMTGSIALSGTGGQLLALIPFGGELYCFREHALLRLTADESDRNFRFSRVPIPGQTVRKDSVADCGSYVAFLTERGLAVLESGKCRLVRTAFCGVRPVLPAQAAGYGGKYYFSAEKPDGKKCVYVYDPAGADSLLDEEADLLASTDEGVYFIHGTDLYRLTASPGTKERSVCYTLDIGGSGGKPCYFAGVTVFGRGTFEATAETEEGKAEFALAAGKRHVPERFLRGERLVLRLGSSDGDAKIAAVNVHLREGTV